MIPINSFSRVHRPKGRRSRRWYRDARLILKILAQRSPQRRLVCVGVRAAHSSTRACIHFCFGCALDAVHGSSIRLRWWRVNAQGGIFEAGNNYLYTFAGCIRPAQPLFQLAAPATPFAHSQLLTVFCCSLALLLDTCDSHYNSI